MSAVLTRENARGGIPLAELGGLPPTLAELQAASLPKPAQAMPVVAVTPSPIAQISNISPDLARILRPQAAYRWLLPYLASITPTYVESVLRGALAGNHVQCWELFDLMIDSNPEIAACVGEYVDGVTGKKLIIEPYHEEDEQPTPSAIKKQKIVSAALRNMRPDPAADENNLKATIRDIVFSRFHGQSILEEDWLTLDGQLNRISLAGIGNIAAPRTTFWVHPICYAWDIGGRLGLRNIYPQQIADVSRAAKNQKPGTRNYGVNMDVTNWVSGQPQPGMLVDFPDNKFIIGVFKAKSGSPLGASCLRSIAAWWVFENFSADYAMDLAQIFGIPFRTATLSPTLYKNPDEVNFVREMLQNMGSRGWALLPEGAKLDFEKAMATGADSPQGFLIKLCQEQYRKVILRQTMTGSGHGGASSGSKAGMGVESDVKGQCLQAGADFVCDILREQTARHILMVNLGDDSELPFISMGEDESGNLEDAQIIQALAPLNSKLIGVNYVRKLFSIPAPAAGEDTMGPPVPAPNAPGAAIAPKPGADDPNKPATPPANKSDKELAASAAAAPIQSSSHPAIPSVATAVVETFAPLVKYLKAGLDLPADAQQAFFQRALAKWPQLTKPMQHDPAVSETIAPALVQSFVDGLAQKSKGQDPKSKVEASRPLEAGDVAGHEFHGNQYAAAIGKSGTWKELGLPHARAMKTDALEPAADPKEARERLEKGFTVKDYAGKDLKFGPKILEHWGETAKVTGESDRRLRRLNDAVKTAQEPREVFEQTTVEGKQNAYIRASQDAAGKRRYHFGFLADKEGTVHTFFHTPSQSTANSIRKGVLLHGRD